MPRAVLAREAVVVDAAPPGPRREYALRDRGAPSIRSIRERSAAYIGAHTSLRIAATTGNRRSWTRGQQSSVNGPLIGGQNRDAHQLHTMLKRRAPK